MRRRSLPEKVWLRETMNIVLPMLPLLLICIHVRGSPCPILTVEEQAGEIFNVNISTENCTYGCPGPGCVVSVSEIKNYNLTITDCFSIRIQGDVHPGDKNISFEYKILCGMNTPPFLTEEASMLVRGVEMEIVLDRNTAIISSGSTVELSCFSHLNDSSDISVVFQLVNGNITHTALCPTDIGTETGYCLEPTQGSFNWRICRNQTKPHNCILIVDDFQDLDDGSYSCSTIIGDKEVKSNTLQLQTMNSIAPAEIDKQSDFTTVVALSIAIFCLFLLLAFIILAVQLVRKRRQINRRNDYIVLPDQDQLNEGIYTPNPSQESLLPGASGSSANGMTSSGGVSDETNRGAGGVSGGPTSGSSGATSPNQFPMSSSSPAISDEEPTVVEVEDNGRITVLVTVENELPLSESDDSPPSTTNSRSSNESGSSRTSQESAATYYSVAENVGSIPK